MSILTTIGIILVLSTETIEFFGQVSPLDFLFGTKWEPLLEPKSFGVLPLVSGTLMIMVGSGLIAIPIGLFTAVYLSEYSSFRTRQIIKPVLEILAGIPTIVYGYFALTFITPVLKNIFPDIEVFNALSGAIVVGIMILPMVSSLCDDAFQGVPRQLKDGGYALGATSFEVIGQVVIPAAASRIMAAFILALSRAIGETMAVTLAAGATPIFRVNPLESIQTMTAYIVQVSLGDTPAGGVEYLTCFAVASLLFVITLFMNVIGQSIMYRVKKKATR
ncbi:MAG: phosphate ABC transporter permease subunit PstC [Bacteriovoracaceae bacterium]|nr:phosphate ABC transporter permease subunit PstC [Bacteriovoracaceae bacterium]